jgi:hypothetical protein
LVPAIQKPDSARTVKITKERQIVKSAGIQTTPFIETKTYHNVPNVKILGSSKEKVVVHGLRVIRVDIPGISLLKQFRHGSEFAIRHIKTSHRNNVVVLELEINHVAVHS